MAEATLNVYEAMFLIGPAAQTQNDHGVGMCRGIIERHGGQITVIKKWDERKLAYEIKRQKRGTYIIAFFKAPGNAIAAIERDVKLSDDILRVLVTTADHLNDAEMNAVEPQPIIREERPQFDRSWNETGSGGGGGGGRGGDRYERPDRGSDRGDRGGERPAPRPRRDDHPAETTADKD